MLVLLICGVSFATDINETHDNMCNSITNENICEEIGTKSITTYFTEDTNNEIDYKEENDLKQVDQDLDNNCIVSNKTDDENYEEQYLDNYLDFEDNTMLILKSQNSKTKHIYVNPTSNINNPDGSSSKPYKTLNIAINKTLAGYDNIIHLSSGNHQITQTITISNRIHIIGNSQTSTSISCNNKRGFNVNNNTIFTIEKVKVQNANYSQGGVFKIGSNIKFVINDCIFTKNKARNGVVLFCAGNNVKSNITNSRFEQNTGYQFGALQLGGSNSLFNIKSCIFADNVLTSKKYSESTGGAAIYAGTFAKVNIYDSIFSRNKAIWGNAILNGNHATIKIYNSNFTNNIADKNINGINKTKGGAIAVGSGYAEIRQCRFINNKADIGGAITFNSGEPNLIVNSIFQQNTAYTQAGAINNYGSLTLKNSIFTKNNGTRRGGAILDIGNNEISIQNCSFKDNTVLTTKIEGTSMVPQGGAISISGTCHNISIKNTTFNHNSAYYGGAIYSELQVKKIELEKTLFYNNTAEYGAAIVLAGETTIDTNNVSFNYNRALRKGGAIVVNGSIHGHFANTNFQKNIVSVNGDGDGGAIYINCYAMLDFNKCNFNNNQANKKGGVICSMSVVSISMSYSNITSNKATIGSGIFLNNTKNYKTKKSQINIDTSVFAGNVGDRIFYSVKAYNNSWNNNIISTSWWGSNVIEPRSEFHFKIKNYFLLTITINNKRNDNIVWTKNEININLTRLDYQGKTVCLSFTTIKEGNTLKYTDAFLPSRTFKLKENNNLFTTKMIYVNYKLNSNLNTIQINLDNQMIKLVK